MRTKDSEDRPAGYAYILETLGLAAMPHWHASWVSRSGSHKSEMRGGTVHDIYPKRYWPGEKVSDHLEFALKYDGTNLALLSLIFEKAPKKELGEYIRSRPTGKYARKIWFFHEFLTGGRLPVDDASSGNYIEALEPDKYHTLHRGRRSPRHRVVDNLLGPVSFCPLVRKTEKLAELDSSDLGKRCADIIAAWPPELLHRALSYLYNSETKSSFEIEHIKPSASRTERFIALLKLAEKEDFCEKKKLTDLQNRIVDPRFRDSDYRTGQNYVGQTVVRQKEIIHFIPPRPYDLPGLMAGLIESHERMGAGEVSPVIHAATIAYGFVFLHPFEDGNGRIHRFLIHNILSLREMVPRGLMFPISAVMLKNGADYASSLEAFSTPLLQQIDYRLDGTGKMTVENDTARWYRYMDMTPQAEALYGFAVRTVEEELTEELDFLARHDKTRRAIQEIIDMPERLTDLFIRLCLQNNGTLSEGKRSAHFSFITDPELGAMEMAVRKGMGVESNRNQV